MKKRIKKSLRRLELSVLKWQLILMTWVASSLDRMYQKKKEMGGQDGCGKS